jgi:hypothetical protein
MATTIKITFSAPPELLAGCTLSGIGWAGAAATGVPQDAQTPEVEAKAAPHFVQMPAISSLLEIARPTLHKTQIRFKY